MFLRKHYKFLQIKYFCHFLVFLLPLFLQNVSRKIGLNYPSTLFHPSAKLLAFCSFLIIFRVSSFDGCVIALAGHCSSQPVQNTTQLLGFFTTDTFFPWFSSNSYAPSVQYSTHFPQLTHFS